VRGRRDRIASPEEATKLLDALPENDRGLWATAAYAGLRAAELQALGLRDVVRDRLAAFRDAGVGTLMVTPMAFTAEDRIAQLRAVAELAA